MNKRTRDLVKDIEKLGYAYDRTNSKNTDYYIHEDTGCEVRLPQSVNESSARITIRVARSQVGLPTKDNKRNPQAIRERNAAEHAKASAELARIKAQRDTITDETKLRAVEEAYLRAERKFRYWDRMMRQTVGAA